MELFALELFAQRGGGGGGGAGGGGGDAGAAGALGAIMCVYGVIIIGAIIINILFLLAMSRCLQQISRRNRQMEPGQVWLCLIPIFGFVWTILMIIRISDSLRDEYYDRRLRGDGDFGKSIGIWYIVSSILCGPVGLIFFIMYWVKIAAYTKELIADRRRGSGDYDDGDDYQDDDDRPRRKRRDERDDRDDRDEDDDDRDDRGGGGKPWDRGRR